MKLNPFAVMREEFDGSGVVFDPDNNKVMALNATGVVLWKAFAEGVTPPNAAWTLMENFRGVTLEQAQQDTRKFIDQLMERSLLSEE